MDREAEAFAVSSRGHPPPGRARAEGEEMSEKTESFDAFLSHWLNERIQKLGEVDPVDREDIIEKKAAGALRHARLRMTERTIKADSALWSSAEGEGEIMLHGRNPKQPVDATRG